MSPGSTPLVIGIGHPDRSDDAIGLEVARRAASFAEAELTAGDPADLIALWHGRRRVILVDAVRTGEAPGKVSVWDLLTESVATNVVHSSHALGPVEAIEIGRALGMLPGELTLVGIEGKTFEISNQMSPEVSEAAEPALATIRSLISAPSR